MTIALDSAKLGIPVDRASFPTSPHMA